MKKERRLVKKRKISSMKSVVTFFISLVFIISGLTIYFVLLPNSSMQLLGINTCITSRSNYLTVISLHYTIVFLTTGLMSILGAKEDYVYYVDIVNRQLLEPIGFNFKDLSCYSFLSIAISAIGIILRSSFVVLYAALIGIICVATIFFKMIDIYFGRERWKIKVFEEIMSAKEHEFQEHLRDMDIIIKKNVYTLTVNADITSIADNLAFLFVLLLENKEDERKTRYIKVIISNAIDLIKENRNISISEFFLYIIDASKSTCKLLFYKRKEDKTKDEEVQRYISLYFMELFLQSNENFFLDENRRDEMKALYEIDEYNGLKLELDKQKKIVEQLCKNKERYFNSATKYEEKMIADKSESRIEAEKLIKIHLISRYPNAFYDNDIIYDEIKQLFDLDAFNHIGVLDNVDPPYVMEEDFVDVEPCNQDEMVAYSLEGAPQVPIEIPVEKAEEYIKEEASSGRVCFFIPEILFSLVGEERGVKLLEELFQKSIRISDETEWEYENDINPWDALLILGGCASWIARKNSLIVAEWLAEAYSNYYGFILKNTGSLRGHEDYEERALKIHKYICVHCMLYGKDWMHYPVDGMIHFWETIVNKYSYRLDYIDKFKKVFIKELENQNKIHLICFEEDVTYLKGLFKLFSSDDENEDTEESEDLDDLPFA